MRRSYHWTKPAVARWENGKDQIMWHSMGGHVTVWEVMWCSVGGHVMQYGGSCDTVWEVMWQYGRSYDAVWEVRNTQRWYKHKQWSLSLLLASVSTTNSIQPGFLLEKWCILHSPCPDPTHLTWGEGSGVICWASFRSVEQLINHRVVLIKSENI